MQRSVCERDLRLLPGVPPWNNENCTISIRDSVHMITPKERFGGQNDWHPPSRQVSALVEVRVLCLVRGCGTLDDGLWCPW